MNECLEIYEAANLLKYIHPITTLNAHFCKTTGKLKLNFFFIATWKYIQVSLTYPGM